MKPTIFFVTADVLVEMIEGSKGNLSPSSSASKMLDLMGKFKANNVPFVKFLMTMATLQRAIWMVHSDSKIAKLQEVIEHITLIPHDPIDFKNEQIYQEHIIKVAEAFSKANP